MTYACVAHQTVTIDFEAADRSEASDMAWSDAKIDSVDDSVDLMDPEWSVDVHKIEEVKP